jgi:Sulfotransferase family
VGRVSGRPPFFVVGCARSGTTLLRTMLDGHPQLAVPPESHFVVGLSPRWWRPGRRPTLDDVLAHPKVRAWDVDPVMLRARAEAADARAYPALVDAVFSAYAAEHGKARWGDKTPGYVSYLPDLARLFPEARFVHLVRDGREVAASLAEWDWGARTAVSGAFWWAHKVRVGRRDGARLGPDRYLELRLEDLLADPEATLRRLCAFLGEEFAPAMLGYPERMAAAGGPVRRQERHLVRPPTPGLRDWRDGLSSRDQAAVEEVCRPMLAAFGYAAPPPRRSARAVALAVRSRDLVVTGTRDVRARLSPATREF